MRHLFKNLIAALIVTFFVFTPEVIAKPAKIKDKDVNKVYDLVKKNKRGVKVSSFVEANKPLLKRSVYKRITRDAFPFWDKKMSVVFGKDTVKISYKGKTLFAKYVDRGPVAFIVNKKPVLWKDVLTYDKAKARLEEIIRGESSKKVSLRDKFFGKMSSFAFAGENISEKMCSAAGRESVGGGKATASGEYTYTICKACKEGFNKPSDDNGKPISDSMLLGNIRIGQFVDNNGELISSSDQRPSYIDADGVMHCEPTAEFCNRVGREFDAGTKKCGLCKKPYFKKPTNEKGEEVSDLYDESVFDENDRAVPKDQRPSYVDAAGVIQCEPTAKFCKRVARKFDKEKKRCGLCRKGFRKPTNEKGEEISNEDLLEYHYGCESNFAGKKVEWTPLSTVAALSLFSHMRAKVQMKDLPLRGWISKGKCPTKGVRGLTSKDIPLGCRNCEKTNSCDSVESESLDSV